MREWYPHRQLYIRLPWVPRGLVWNTKAKRWLYTTIMQHRIRFALEPMSKPLPSSREGIVKAIRSYRYTQSSVSLSKESTKEPFNNPTPISMLTQLALCIARSLVCLFPVMLPSLMHLFSLPKNSAVPCREWRGGTKAILAPWITCLRHRHHPRLPSAPSLLWCNVRPKISIISAHFSTLYSHCDKMGRADSPSDPSSAP